jgi:hypothetical protein
MAQPFPCSPYQCEQGLFYFPRMLEKIRLRQRGELAQDYHANLGKGFDHSDAEVFAWCCKEGRKPDAHEIHVWNEYMRKRGWTDEFAERLKSRLEGLGMAGRTDVLTMFDLLEVDEGRPPRGAGAVS